MVELADTPDLGSGAERRAGSSPAPRTIRGNSSVVELHLAKVDVAGSSPVSRYSLYCHKRQFISIYHNSYYQNITGNITPESKTALVETVDLIPKKNKTYDLGSSSGLWNNFFSNIINTQTLKIAGQK